MSLKNPGKILYFSRYGGERPIPEQFIAAMDRAETRQFVPNDTELPAFPSDTIVEARFETNREGEKQLITISKKAGRIGPLLDFRTTDQGQSVQVAATMFRTLDVDFPRAEPSATQDVNVRDLGNGWSIQEVAVAGTLVDGTFTAGIFQGVELTTRREDPVPTPFRIGLKTQEVQSIEKGTVAQPTLGTNDIESRERQIAQYKKIITRQTRDGVTLPFTLVNMQTNERKQLVVVSETYRLASTTPSVSTTQDVKVTDLGDGHEVVTTELAPALFGGEKYSKEINDLFPEKFRGLIPKVLATGIVAGTATAPTLGVGELMRSEQQITALTKLVEVLSRAGVSFPVTITDSATITEYGGGRVNIVQNINVNGTYTPDEGEGVVQSKVTKLGNGYELQETVYRVAGSWPLLHGSHYDRVTGLVENFTEQVVAEGSSGGGVSSNVVTEYEPRDGVRRVERKTTLNTSGLDALIIPIEGTTSVDLPAELTSLESVEEHSVGEGSYSENGVWVLGYNTGSGSMSLRGNAQASVASMMDLKKGIKQPWGNGVKCVFYLFYVPIGTARATILTKLSTAAGHAIADWPKFVPEPLTFVCSGNKVSLDAKVGVSASEGLVTDYLGVVKTSGYSRSQGGGFSWDVAVSQKVIQISGTIHAALSFTDTTAPWHASAAATISLGTSGAASGISAVCAAGSNIKPASVGATAGQATFAGLGYCVHRLSGELSTQNPGYLKYIAEVVNFADLQ